MSVSASTLTGCEVSVDTNPAHVCLLLFIHRIKLGLDLLNLGRKRRRLAFRRWYLRSDVFGYPVSQEPQNKKSNEESESSETAENNDPTNYPRCASVAHVQFKRGAGKIVSEEGPRIGDRKR